jgi:hypothetical protein
MKRILLLLIALTVANGVGAEELPPTNGDPTVIGQVEHEGYGLVGSRGRFYVFGGIAMADYSDSAGTRRIVTLQHEDQIRDAKHLHYRELREGHRWAFSRQRGPDGQFGVWIQPAAKMAAVPAGPPGNTQGRRRSRADFPRQSGIVPAVKCSRAEYGYFVGGE